MPKRPFVSASPLGAILSLFSSWGYYLLLKIPSPYIWIGIIAGISAHFTLLYIFASKYQRTPLGESLRGAIVGLNAGFECHIYPILHRKLDRIPFFGIPGISVCFSVHLPPCLVSYRHWLVQLVFAHVMGRYLCRTVHIPGQPDRSSNWLPASFVERAAGATVH